MSDKTSLEVKITSSDRDGILTFEGSVTLPSLAKTKLANKDGITKFTTLSALKGVAGRAASRYGYSAVTYDESSFQRKAAKRASTPTF